jgi:carboxypeptidase D
LRKKHSVYDPKLDLTTHKLTLVGESYAGTYIPSVGRGIYLNNARDLPNMDGSKRFRVPLTGIAIGNGKIDAITQSRAIPDWAYWHGLIDMGTRDFFKAEFERCTQNMKSGVYGPGVEPKPFHSFTLRSDCGIFDSMLEAAGGGALDPPFDGGPNIYEYSTWDAYEAADGNNGTVSRFYNHPDVQEALNVPHHRRGDVGHRWEGCIPEVDANWVGNDPNDASDSPNFMDNDKPWDVTPYIAELLDDAMINVLIYSGDRDMICNTQGSDAALAKMEWSGTKDPAPSSGIASRGRNAWTEARRGLWLYDGYPAGYTKSYKNLNLLSIYVSVTITRCDD